METVSEGMMPRDVHAPDCTGRAPEVPAGYHRTELGMIPEDWGIEAISTIANVKTGPFGSALHERDYVDDGTPIVTVEHLSEHGIRHQNLPLVSDTDRLRLKSYLLRPGDIVFSRVGSVDRNSLVSQDEDGWLFSGRLLRVRILSEDLISARYLSYHLHTESFKKRVYSLAVGQTMASLNTQILRAVQVVLPPILEQYAIAAVLSDVDELILSLEALIAKKRDIKHAAMQQLLTGRTRLPGFGGEWGTVTLGEIGDTYGGLAGKTSADFGDGGARYIAFLDVLEKVILTRQRFDRVSVARSESQNRVMAGDVLFNATSETPEDLAMGSMVVVDADELYLNSFCFGYRMANRDRCDPLFLAYFSRGVPGRQAMYALAQGATRYNLSKKRFLMLQLLLPPLPEQQAIASLLSDMDDGIAALEHRLDKTRAIKQGMMQQLLTGTIRLPIPNDDTEDDHAHDA